MQQDNARPRIIAVVNKKGGVTKTTTSMQLAGWLAKWGNEVTVLDTDSTGGATKWAEGVEDENERRIAEGREPVSLGFQVVPANETSLNRDRLLRRYRGWVIIDTPPVQTGIIQKAVDAADVTIIPCEPSMLSLYLAGETFAETPHSIVLLTRTKRNTRLTKESLEELDSNDTRRFDTVVTEREAIKRMAGTTQLDSQEYSSVAQELIDYMDMIDAEEE